MRAPWRPGSSEEAARAGWARATMALLLLTPWLLAHCGGGADSEACPTTDGPAHVDSWVGCLPWEDAKPWVRSTAIRMGVQGDNGVFLDVCLDGCGAVRQFECEVVESCSESGDLCGWTASGQVVSNVVFCPCADGRCLSGCPFTGDTMHLEGEATAEKATLVDETTGRKYACKPWGCSPKAGAEVTMDEDSGWCTKGQGAFHFGSADVGWCRFTDCALLP